MENKTKKRSFKELMVDTFMMSGVSTEWIPFVLFLACITLFWISNTYYAEKNVREIYSIRNEVKELKTEHMSSKLDLLNKSKQSQVAKYVKHKDLKESRTAPKKLIINKDEY